MWTIPGTIDAALIEFSRGLNCTWIGAVKIQAESAYDFDDCHNNVAKHCEIYGGRAVKGWYYIAGFDTIQAIRHTVWHDNTNLIDVTPCEDLRSYNMFAISADQTDLGNICNCYYQSLAKYGMQENNTMYYVYQLVDPRNEQPFYVGKGKGRRAKTHLWEVPETRNVYKENKIATIRAAGYEPKISYVAENITDETLAYDIEEKLIKSLGRKGYEANGILTNVCQDNRPPNHKGKTYEEIYGTERAAEQRKLRADKQQARGGYGPKKHTSQTIAKIQAASAGENNGMHGRHHSPEAKARISEKAKQRVGATNKLSKTYILTAPTQQQYILIGGELGQFCKENNLSLSTLKKQIQKDACPPKYGKTAGWKLTTKV